MFDEYDKGKIENAKQLLERVYEYNYGAPADSKLNNRLFTIICKIEELQTLIENN